MRRERRLTKAMRAIFAGLLLILCSTTVLLAADDSDIVHQRNQVREMAREGLSALYEAQPGARYAIEHAAGYGVFSVMGVKIFFAGGTTGKGLVHDNRTHRDTFMRMVQAQAGLGFGAVKDRIIWVFETHSALKDFINSGWDFGGKAQASAMVQQQGGTFAGAISVSPGVWVYQLTETGLSAELTITGTKYYKDSDLN
jgi:lipid-binding SYLF domain-containing protein